MPEPNTSRRQPIPLREQRAKQLQNLAEQEGDPEAIKKIWETKKDLVLLADENRRLKEGLNVIQLKETGEALQVQEIPGLDEAQDLVDAFRETHRGLPITELVALIRNHLDETVRTEINGARSEGLPVPSAEEAILIKEYVEVEQDTQRILKGLEDLSATPPRRSREAARAQHFMARVPTENPTLARAKANENLRLKKAELAKSKILVP